MFKGLKSKSDKFEYELDGSFPNEIEENHKTIDNENEDEP